MNKKKPKRPRIKNYLSTKIIAHIIIVTGYLFIIAVFLYVFPKIKDFSSKNKVLHIYAWADAITFDSLQEFEKEHNIKVSIKYFDTNEELFAKFKINKGEGYDLITASDHMIDLLHKHALLAPLDHKLLPVINELDTRFLNYYYDPTNLFSLPYSWVTYGIIYNKSIFKKPPAQISLELLFKNPENLVPEYIWEPYKVCMIDDPRETSFFAHLYLFDHTQKLDANKIPEIKKLLIKQKKWVECYVYQDLRYLLFSETFHVAISASTFVRKIFETSNNFEFVIPKEGSMLVTENFAIPKKSKNILLTHKLINYLLSRPVATQNSQTFGYNPTNKNSYQDIDKKFFNNPNFFPDNSTFDKLQLLRSDVPIKKLTEMWWEIKSS